MPLGSDALHAVLAALPGVTVGRLDPQWCVVEVAGSWLERTGLTSEQVVGRRLADIGGATLAEMVAPAVRAAFGGEPARVRLTNPVRAVDPAAPAWIELTFAAAEPEPASGELQVLWVLRDVSLESELGNALTAAEQRLAMTDDDVQGHALFTLDVDGVVSGWGPATQRMLGYTPADMVGHHLSRLFPAAAVRLGVAHGLLGDARGLGSRRAETVVVDVDGRELRIEISVRVLRDAQFEPVGFAAMIRDLTAHQHAQATLRMREAMYRAAFDEAPSGMALVERQSDGRWDIIEANTALASLVGHSASSLVGGVARLRADGDGDGLVHEVFELARGAQGQRYEVALMRADGSRRRVIVGLSALHVDGAQAGHATRYVAQIFDVTARREAERATAEALEGERRASAELRELQRQRADFLATVSHELRTPLASVLGFVELLAEGDLGALDPRQHHALDAIDRNSRRLRDLVEDLLVMSSVEQGSPRRPAVPTPVAAVLAAALDRVRPDAEARGTHLRETPGLAAAVDIEAALLQRVVLALLTNAVKFTPAGGTVGVGVDLRAGRAEIEVVDDGVGISAADLPRIFDPFFRAAASARLVTSGTGLGLSLVRALVQLHGGEVTAESEPGVRTRFLVSLPVSEPVSEPLAAVMSTSVETRVPVGGAA